MTSDNINKKVHPGAMLVVIALTIIYGMITYSISDNLQQSIYRKEHNVQPYTEKVWWWTEEKEHSISASDIGMERMSLYVWLPSLLILVLTPIIGRISVNIFIGLSHEAEKVFNLDEGFEVFGANYRLLMGGIWPITLVVSFFLLLGVIFGYLFNAANK